MRSDLMRKKKIAANISREVSKFWRQMYRVVEYKQRMQLEVVKKEALEKHLDFIVNQTERFTADLSKNFKQPSSAAAAKLPGPSQLPALPAPAAVKTEVVAEAANPDDADFDPAVEQESDDEATMDAADEPVDVKQEIDTLNKEGEMSLEELLAMYPGYGQDNGGDDDDIASDATDQEPEVKEEAVHAAKPGDGTQGDDDDDASTEEDEAQPESITAEAAQASRAPSQRLSSRKHRASQDDQASEDAHKTSSPGFNEDKLQSKSHTYRSEAHHIHADCAQG